MVLPVIQQNRIGVFGLRDPQLGTEVIGGQPTLVAIIGQTLGAVTNISDEAVTRNALSAFDELTQTVVNFISKVSDVQGGIANYVNNVDYELDSGNHVLWLGTKVQPPTSPVATPIVHAGGTLAAGTYRYKVTAIRLIAVPSTNGETTPSAEVSAVVGPGGTNSVQVSWTPSVNAQGYNIYRTAVNGGTNTETLLATVMGGASNGFLDDGSLTPGVQTPPVTNTANNRPADGANYFVSYNATITTYFQPELFESVNDLINAHSLTSDLCVAGTIILGNTSGVAIGQGASKVLTVAVPPSPTLSNFQQALQALENEPVDIIVILDGTPANQLAVAQHVVAMSDPNVGKPRMAVFGNPKGTPIGDASTPGTMVFNARALNIDDEFSNPQGYRMIYVANSSFFYNVQFPDGNPLEQELDGWFLAAAIAGRIAALADTATPLTQKNINGVLSLGQVFSINQRDFLEQNGLLVVQANQQNTQFLVYHGRTLDVQILENSEISIVRTDDFLDITLRQIFTPYVGSKITDGFLKAVKTVTDQVLGSFLALKLISAYDKGTIVVQENPVLKTRVDVSFLYTPIFPANQIVFTRGYNLA